MLFRSTPAFSQSATGNDKLVYWSKDIGAAPAGQTVAIALRYVKSDSRTSKKILEESAPATASAPDKGSAPPAAPSIDFNAVTPTETVMRGSSESKDDWMPAVFLLLLAALAAGVLWFNLRSTGQAPEKASDRQFCSQCGNKLHRGDRFCSKCGTAVG